MIEIFIQHRLNTVNQLRAANPQFGAEIDLRAGEAPGSVLLHHDPWAGGESFLPWIEEYRRLNFRGPLILNTKEDTLEEYLMEKMAAAGITNYLFLDTTIPTLVKWVKRGQGHRFMLRQSVYETGAVFEMFRGKVEWIWADCFEGMPPERESLVDLGKDYRICLVSPELHLGGVPNVAAFANLYDVADAVCTKVPENWKKAISAK